MVECVKGKGKKKRKKKTTAGEGGGFWLCGVWGEIGVGGGEWVAVGYRRVGDDVVQAKEKSPR